MTIAEYLKNPYGKGSAVSQFITQKQMLDHQFVMFRDRYLCKIYKHRNVLIYHVVVPSASKKDDTKTYDVVIEVDLSALEPGIGSINDLDFKVFSNCPSFIFTYAHAFYKNRMMCKWLTQKYSQPIEKMPASIRNRFSIIGLEKSVYLALKFITTTGRTGAAAASGSAIKVTNRNSIIASVRSQDQIMRKESEDDEAARKPDPSAKTKAFSPKSSYTGSHAIKNEIASHTKMVQNASHTTRTSRSTTKNKTTKKVKRI